MYLDIIFFIVIFFTLVDSGLFDEFNFIFEFLSETGFSPIPWSIRFVQKN